MFSFETGYVMFVFVVPQQARGARRAQAEPAQERSGHAAPQPVRGGAQAQGRARPAAESERARARARRETRGECARR